MIENPSPVHDWSPVSDHCTACALPFHRADLPCLPSTDTDPDALADLAWAALNV
jgi:hypothetical protein